MEQHPSFEPFDPFAEPDPRSKPIQLNLNDFDAPEPFPPPRYRGEVAEEPPLSAFAKPTPPPPPAVEPTVRREREPERPARPARELEPPRPTVAAPPALERDSLLESDDYVRARHVAEMKFSLLVTTLGLLIANLGLAALAYFQVQPTGQWWFVWPLGFSALYLLARFIKVYVLQGLDLRSLKERRLQEMTLREVRRRRMFSQ